MAKGADGDRERAGCAGTERLKSTSKSAGHCERPLIVRCGAFGDMVLITVLVRALHARFRCPVDIVTSGPWSEPLLRGQPGVGEIFSVRSRKTPYWLSADQRRVVRQLRSRGVGPTWFCDGNEAARPMLTRAGFTDDYLVDVRDHPLLPNEHATEQWQRLSRIMPAAIESRERAGGHQGELPPGELPPGELPPGDPLREREEPTEQSRGCYLWVSEQQQADLDAWLRQRGLEGKPLILIQVGNKRTMRRGLRRLAINSKYWPNERWAEVIQYLRAQWPKHRIVLLGTGPEYLLNEEVSACARVEGLYNAADDLPIPRLVALLARGAGLISVDSGPAHAAAAVGCPEVVLFGKALPSLYRPIGVAGADVIVLCGRVDGEPNMLGITSDEVMKAWAAIKLRGAAG
jgi:ADP-heptose:LPS heptosyltransferase